MTTEELEALGLEGAGLRAALESWEARAAAAAVAAWQAEMGASAIANGLGVRPKRVYEWLDRAKVPRARFTGKGWQREARTGRARARVTAES